MSEGRSEESPLLFSDRGCPFAHRVLALLEHTGCSVERHESEVGARPAGLERYSASGRIPLLVHGGIVITESRVMLEHLAEHFALDDALPSDLPSRTLHRHAMAVTDDFLAPRLVRPLADEERARLDDTLRALETAVATTSPRPCLLTFHVAPIWLRFRWWLPSSPITRAVEARASLREWLDAAIELDAIVRTAPIRQQDLADLERARKAGVLPTDSTLCSIGRCSA